MLVGFMGAGKTTVGRALAALLDVSFVDLDELVASAARRSIPELFAAEGEAAFRERELAALARQLDGGCAAVIAAGGGIVTFPPSRRRLARRGATVVWLDAGFDACWRRAAAEGGARKRPMLAGGAEAARLLLRARRPLYGEVASLRVRSDRGAPEAVAGRIVRALRRARRT